MPHIIPEPNDLSDFYERYVRCCNERRFDELSEFVADDYLGQSAGGLGEVVAGFPDYHWQLHRLLVAGQWLAAHLYGTGTHTGSFAGVPATGRTIRTQELVIYRLHDGKIAESWTDLVPVVRDALTSTTSDQSA